MEKRVLEEYYRLLDPKERKACLEKDLAEACSEQDASAFSEHADTDCTRQEELLLRKELFDIRYEEQTVKGKTELIDRFFKIWLELSFRADNALSERGKKKALKELSKSLESSGVLAFRQKGKTARYILYSEFCHLVSVYIYSSENSKFYSRYFDIIPMSKEKVISKINRDITNTLIDYPAQIGLDAMLPELGMAAEDELDYYNRLHKKETLSDFKE